MRRSRFRVAGAVVAMCLLAACSSDDDTSPSTSSSATSATSVADTTAAETTVAQTSPVSTSVATTSPPTTVDVVPATTAPPATTVPVPVGPITVTGPVEGGNGIAIQSGGDLAAAGYIEEEYFIEGDATSYAAVGELGPDGKWAVEPAETMPYRTRIIVRRPDVAAFSGSVFVEWMNVTSGTDAGPDWGYASDELIREGHAWVGVSAQAVGVVGGETIMGDAPGGTGGLVGADPERYGSLSHPGDEFSFDMFTQAAASLTSHSGPSPLADLPIDHVIATGESQSSFFLTTYINSVQPIVGLFDGFFIHSRTGSAPSPSAEQERATADNAVAIRDDGDVPVLVFLTETDVTLLGAGFVDQPDSNFVRVWESAGTSHADAFLLEEVYGIVPGSELASLIDCPAPLNSGPHHEILQAAVNHLVAWVIDGTEPPVAPRLELASTEPLALARDDLGIALGGIRSPLVDVPVAVLSGDMVEDAPSFCALFGSTTPLDAATLAELYPTADAYLEAFDASLQEMIEAGFILEADAGRLTAVAEEAAATMSV